MNVIHATIALFGACSLYFYAVVARALGELSRTSASPDLVLPNQRSPRTRLRRGSLRPKMRKQSQAGTTYCVVGEHSIIAMPSEAPRRLSRRPVPRVSGFRRRLRVSIRAQGPQGRADGPRARPASHAPAQVRGASKPAGRKAALLPRTHQVNIPRLRTLRLSDFYSPEACRALDAETDEQAPPLRRAAGDKPR